MKYYKLSEMWRASNVSFNPNNVFALSYNWWEFVKVVNGLTVFNNYNYSPTTRKHQAKVRKLMKELGIAIDLEIECPNGLQDIASCRVHYKNGIDKLVEAMGRPRSKLSKNLERAKAIKMLDAKLKVIEALLLLPQAA